MQYDWTLKLGDIAIVFATLFAPFAAIQAQKYLERWHDREKQRKWVFRTLMQTRAQSLSPAHIDALNAVPIEFNNEKKILNVWREYFSHLGKPADTTENWGPKRIELLIDLLHKMSIALKYSFEKTQIQSEIYSPNAQVELDTNQQIVQRGLARLFKGEWAFPMNVVGFPSNKTEIEEQKVLRDLFTKWLSGDTSVSMNFKTDEQKDK